MSDKSQKPAPVANKINPAIAAKAQKSAKPQVAQVATEDEQKGRPKHPLVGSTNPEVYPFAAIPADFDFDTMASLKKGDFKEEAVYFEYKAAAHEHIAKKFRERAEEARLVGDKADRGKAKRLLRMQAKMEELRKELEKSGVNVDELLKNLQAQAAAAPAPATTTAS